MKFTIVMILSISVILAGMGSVVYAIPLSKDLQLEEGQSQSADPMLLVVFAPETDPYGQTDPPNTNPGGANGGTGGSNGGISVDTPPEGVEVPEPSTLALFVLGALGIVAVRRRKSRK